MRIGNLVFQAESVYDESITIPDSFVFPVNKTCNGHGEAKLYMGPKDSLRTFYTGSPNQAGFKADCFMLRSDLEKFMNEIKREYQQPSILYRGMNGNTGNMMEFWKDRKKKISSLPNVIYFTVTEQKQISGDRGYVNAHNSNAYSLIRELALPFVSYLSVMKVREKNTKGFLFYWRIFVDYTQMSQQQYIATHYGSKNYVELGKIRKGQLRYRLQLFDIYKHCPFTKIDDPHILVASHIKPWAVCRQGQKYDPNNGFLLSPLYDKLFDKGYISFDDNGRLLISDWLSQANKKRISFNYDKSELLLNDERKKYLRYHRDHIFK